jgi:predicted glutamine amidotransferase
MCRMIAYVGNSSVGLENLFNVFREGSKCDPYAKAVFGLECTGHPHGWGLALYDGVRLHHYRSSLPVWEDEFRLPSIKGKRVLAMFHSRLASDPSLDTPISSHPFIASTDREVLLFAHNVGVEMDADAPKLLVDSEWALRIIAKLGGLKKGAAGTQEANKAQLGSESVRG